MLTLAHGDKIRTRARRIPGVWHYGIWDAKRGLVIHNTMPGGVQTTSFAAFANGAVQIETRAGDDGDAIVARARSFIGTDYDLVAFNCEHFANTVSLGEKKSPQLRNAFGLGILVALLWSRKSTYDPAVDRNRDRKGRFTK
jgi:hypothetical protein